ncbi:MAG: SMP-30/gluconolactonase/LRE family protein [Lewinellaceae bacterium]|nr:SMP-30/gluconolactonase/LRE family protein [Saprospiraceae bacterium]MCB9269223.1 SMP-30/gluconolactonase/LRE family protein [Lewinellaceae bacterium]HPG06711.1 SMP-30/gluconolactonase/LRE family protein [Saprospiraceae bacterium]HPR01509.1 SMP-30/gluconolactonase/LRE family protein [Saprospiraceae bacterium]HQU52194.1 SMP-30/gluconolactonase/LRE family protein [Saprospiraceae bacterium]
MNNRVIPVGPWHSVLGEGPIWSADLQAIFWVDIVSGVIHKYHPPSYEYSFREMGEMVGAIVFSDDGRIVTALRSGFAFLDWATGKLEPITDPEAHLPDNRFNDGKCDPAGRFWAGTMHVNEIPDSGNLYRMGSDLKAALVIPGVTVSNGLAWHTEGHTMYYIDSPTRKVMAYAFNMETGDLSHPREIIRFLDSDGYPDGMTIDAENKLWIAHWGGWQVSRWDPETGKKLFRLDLPVEKVTSCVFGGPRLQDLYMTTASIGLPEDGRQPLAGQLFVWRESGFEGVKANVFKFPNL